jgi:plasmid stability protein
MASLQVRELPEHIYIKLAKQAKEDHRSIAQEAVELLSKALGAPLNSQERRRTVLQKIKSVNLFSDIQIHSDPVFLVREEREK